LELVQRVFVAVVNWKLTKTSCSVFRLFCHRFSEVISQQMIFQTYKMLPSDALRCQRMRVGKHLNQFPVISGVRRKFPMRGASFVTIV